MTPPLGLVPEFIWKEERYKEIVYAMARYITEGKEIPQDWCRQGKELKVWIDGRNKCKQYLDDARNNLIKAEVLLNKNCNQTAMDYYKNCVLEVDKAEQACTHGSNNLA